jgi:hypothetical protein
MNLSILFPALSLIPVAILHCIFKFKDRAETAKVAPIGDDEKFLRSPGGSILNWKKQFDDQILENLLLILITPAFFIMAYLSVRMNAKPSASFWITWAVLLSGYLCFLANACYKLWHLYDEREIKRLGFRGERAVGQHLNQLMLHGCRVFHDFPLNGKGNLDHIVVAPSGVYAIETKARRKRARWEDGYVVKYDGKKLQFPEGTDTDFLTQANNQADQLARILTKYLKMPIGVEPVLTLPGWFIERRGKGDVHVLNHKEIASLIVGSKRTVFWPDDIEKISAYLDGKCRDVAF